MHSTSLVLRSKLLQTLAKRSASLAAALKEASHESAGSFALASSFDLSEEHRQLFAASKKFAVDEIVPHAAHYDRQMEFPWGIIQKAHANGYMNLDVPAEYGGLGLDALSNILVCEASAYGCSSVTASFIGNNLAATPVINRGSEELKRKYLARLINEPIMASNDSVWVTFHEVDHLALEGVDHAIR
ncbi:2-methyl branched-chain enoyl CoA reductase isoform I [Aphelenchoides avenae]|nr:2-methyl branched-chain enoyl CoA reductase isoform I [Aphelenchus avenae]